MRCVDINSLEKLFRKNCNMSLVAYGISDDSGSEEESEAEGTNKLIDVEEFDDEIVEEERPKVNVLESCLTSDKEDEVEVKSMILDRGASTMRLPEPNNESSETTDPDEDNVAVLGSGLFSSLPAPKVTSKLSLEMEMDEQPMGRRQLLTKKETVKITVPSLSEFKDDDAVEPERKKLKPSSKGSGLFALLPAPKNMTLKVTKRPLVPNVLTQKPAAITINPAPSVTKQTEKSKPSLTLTSYEDSGDEVEGGDEGDFFSLNSDAVTESTMSALPEGSANSDEGSHVDVAGSDDSASSAVPDGIPSELESEWPAAQESTDGETKLLDQNDQDLLLNKEAMQRLCGRRAARDKAAMQFIEVSGDALMPDPKEWLTKQLTQEQQQKSHSHSHRKNDGPTTQQKRKHQITYLAFQAKENELELKNQWSQNRMSRKQTQSKYGF